MNALREWLVRSTVRVRGMANFAGDPDYNIDVSAENARTRTVERVWR